MKKVLIFSSALAAACASPKAAPPQLETPVPVTAEAGETAESATADLVKMCRKMTLELGDVLVDSANDCDPDVNLVRHALLMVCPEPELDPRTHAGKVSEAAEAEENRCRALVEQRKAEVGGSCNQAIDSVIDFIEELTVVALENDAPGLYCDELGKIRTLGQAMDEVCAEVDELGKPNPYRDSNESHQDMMRRVRAMSLYQSKQISGQMVRAIDRRCRSR